MPAFKRKLAGDGVLLKLLGSRVGANTLSSWIALVAIGISLRKYPASDRSKSCTSSSYLHITFLGGRETKELLQSSTHTTVFRHSIL